METMSSSETKHDKLGERGYSTQARSLKDKHDPQMEVSVLPVPKVLRNHDASDHILWHSERSAGARKSLNSSFINYHSRPLSGRLAKT